METEIQELRRRLGYLEARQRHLDPPVFWVAICVAAGTPIGAILLAAILKVWG